MYNKLTILATASNTRLLPFFPGWTVSRTVTILCCWRLVIWSFVWIERNGSWRSTGLLATTRGGGFFNGESSAGSVTSALPISPPRVVVWTTTGFSTIGGQGTIRVPSGSNGTSFSLASFQVSELFFFESHTKLRPLSLTPPSPRDMRFSCQDLRLCKHMHRQVSLQISRWNATKELTFFSVHTFIGKG